MKLFFISFDSNTRIKAEEFEATIKFFKEHKEIRESTGCN
jgi:hypothetical protein